MSNTGIAVGLKKGYPVTKREKIARPSHSKGVSDLLGKLVLNEMVYNCYFITVILETLQENEDGP